MYEYFSVQLIGTLTAPELLSALTVCKVERGIPRSILVALGVSLSEAVSMK